MARSRFVGSPWQRIGWRNLGRHRRRTIITAAGLALWSAGLLAIWNLNDRSALVVPSLSYPLSNEATARAGAFLGIGSGQTTSAVAVPSGFGVVPATAYGSVSWFF